MSLPRPASGALLAPALAAALLLSACGTPTTDQATAPPDTSVENQSQEAFPVTISHAFGETTIPKAPQRVATVGFANHEVPLALGIVPVGMSKSTWGDDDGNGLFPWVEDALADLGSDTPVLFDETDAIPFEQVADTQPDVILAAYSGITQDDYDKLSKIAPVVAYPDMPWGTSLEDMVTLNATALGKKKEAAELNASLQKQMSNALDEFPRLKNKSVLFTSFGGQDDLSKIGFYTTQDPRAGTLADVGLGVPRVVREASANSPKFWAERSSEDVEAFDDVDLFISYGSNDDNANATTLARLQADPLTGRIPAIREGRVAFLGEGPLAASSNPTPLSIPWGIRDYYARIDAVL